MAGYAKDVCDPADRVDRKEIVHEFLALSLTKWRYVPCTPRKMPKPHQQGQQSQPFGPSRCQRGWYRRTLCIWGRLVNGGIEEGTTRIAGPVKDGKEVSPCQDMVTRERAGDGGEREESLDSGVEVRGERRIQGHRLKQVHPRLFRPRRRSPSDNIHSAIAGPLFNSLCLNNIHF